jgi:hypothetical protein
MRMALSDEKKETVKALLATGMAMNAVAKQCKISWDTVNRISQEEPDKIESIREDKRTAFIDRLWSSMDQALGLADKKIKLAMEAADILHEIDGAAIDEKSKYELQDAVSVISNVPLGQISTFIGTIYDKHALMTGGKTADIGLSFEDELRELINK